MKNYNIYSVVLMLCLCTNISLFSQSIPIFEDDCSTTSVIVNPELPNDGQDGGSDNNGSNNGSGDGTNNESDDGSGGGQNNGSGDGSGDDTNNDPNGDPYNDPYSDPNDGPTIYVITTETEIGYPPGDVLHIDDKDSDGDGLTDIEEGCIPFSDMVPPDTDGDGIPNCEDTDSDNDGVPDGIDWCYLEFGNTPTGCPPTWDDFDGDGILNEDECTDVFDFDDLDPVYDTDSDDDGFPDGGIGADECPCDWGPPDGAGCPKSKDDLDGDGVLNDLEDPCPELDFISCNGFPTTMNPDSDGDGVMDGSDDCPCIYSKNDNGCERSVFWIHGFGGNELSWGQVADYVGTTWKTDSHNNRCIDYSNHQDGSLEDAGDEIVEKLHLQTQGRSYHEQNIAICHSLGGMAMRGIDQVKDENGDKILYDGLVTVATAHYGAGLANIGMEDPEILGDFLSWTCTKLSKPLIDEATEDLPLIQKLIAYEVLDALSDELCLGQGVDLLMDKLNAYNQSSVSSQLTTAHMTSLPPMHAKHNAVIYGEEDGLKVADEEDGLEVADQEDGLGVADGSLTARIFGSVTNAPHDQDLFQAGEAIDDIGMGNFDDLQQDYLLKYEDAIWDYNIALIILVEGGLFGIGENIANYYLAKKRMFDYQGAVDWFTKYHLRWMYLIEAAEIQLGCVCEDWSVSWSLFGGLDHDVDIEPFSESCESIFEDIDDYDYCETTVILQTQLKPNDGFILSESASTAPGINYPNHLMKGSNHLQMRNDLNTSAAMEFIFRDGCGTPGSFFVTEYR